MSLVDDYLESRPHKKRAKNTLYVTDLTKPCLRASMLDILHPKKYPVETLKIFESGNMIEDWWVQKVLRNRVDVEVLGDQVQAYHKVGKWIIHGRVDALCLHIGDGIRIHEVKSIKNASYVRGGGAKPEHIKQIQFYLNALGVEFGFIDYLCKDTMLNGGEAPVDVSFQVTRNPFMFSELLQHAQNLGDAVESGEAVCTPGWLCGYCQHAETCDKGEVQ